MIKGFFNLILGNGDNGDVQGSSRSEMMYADTPGIMKLQTQAPTGEVMKEVFPKYDWPISGGWGYTKDDAVVVECSNEHDGVDLEYKFLEFRTYLEAIVARPEGERLAGFRFERGRQALVHGKNGKPLDVINMQVTAFKEADFEFLKNDWEQHNAYIDDEQGRQKHLALADTKKITYEITGNFDISHFFGKV